MKLFTVFISYFLIFQPSTDGWDIFAKVKFTEKFFKELNEYYLVPFLDSKIKFHEGKEITLEGYYLPYDLNDKNSVVISRNPFSACFFCGAEIVFASKPLRFKADQIIGVTGILKLNDSDINHMNFILEQARLETKK